LKSNELKMTWVGLVS